MHGIFEFPERRHDVTVDRQDHVAVLQDPGCRRARNEAGDAQRAPAHRVVLLETRDPLLVDAHLACREQRGVHELGFERIERLAFANNIDELLRDFGADATIELCRLAACLHGKTRPCRDHLTVLVDEYTIDLTGCIDQRDALDIGVAKAQGS